MSEKKEDLQNIRQRAAKNAWITAILTFFIPFGGYIYTARYIPAVISFFLMIFLLPGGELEEETDADADALYGFFIISAAIENTIAVNKAKRLTKEKGLNPGVNTYNPLPNPKVEMLKIAKAQGEATLSDFVIGTELPTEQIKVILTELEGEDLLRSSNRDADGAIVYRVV